MSFLLPSGQTQQSMILPSELSLYGGSTTFYQQFKVRPLVVQIATGGALGTMTVQWQFLGDTSWSAAVTSEATGAPWVWAVPDPAFAIVTFPLGTYPGATTYTIATTGSVTPGAGALGGVTATRNDMLQFFCDEVTSKLLTWTQPRVVPPVISVGPGIKGWLAAIVRMRLKSRQGMAPPGGGVGDENVMAEAQMAEDNLRAIGRSDSRPPDLVDSSAGGGTVGVGIPVMPIGDDLVGW